MAQHAPSVKKFYVEWFQDFVAMPHIEFMIKPLLYFIESDRIHLPDYVISLCLSCGLLV